VRDQWGILSESCAYGGGKKKGGPVRAVPNFVEVGGEAGAQEGESFLPKWCLGVGGKTTRQPVRNTDMQPTAEEDTSPTASP